MTWYDEFSRVYDTTVDRLYREPRARAVAALGLKPGLCVADLACGTGQSFAYLRNFVGETGEIVGVELSSGMLARARARATASGWTNVHCVQADACSPRLAELTQRPQVAAIQCFLGLSVIPEWEQAFARSFAWLAPGGRYVIADVHAPKPGFYGRCVNWVARAQIQREVWRPLELCCEDFQLQRYRSHWSHGGDFVIASGRKAMP